MASISSKPDFYQ